MKPTLTRPAVILLVEDSEDDMILTREGFRRSKFQVQLHHVWDGEECMAFLRREEPFAGAPSPDLILLDLNLPRMDGRAVLKEIVADEALARLPIIVLTTSEDEDDILRSYNLRCSSYVRKPVSFEHFRDQIQKLGDYWFTVVVLPQSDA
jgi:two-component system, chemotaxis family, response regulator Rcp1